jgi:hypothetical protein
MATLDKLTPEQEALVEQVADEYIQDLTRATLPDGEAIAKWLDIAYGLYDRKRPDRVEIVESPRAALLLASSLTGEKESWLDDCGIGDGGWVAFYDYFSRIEVLSKDESADVLALRDFMRTAWDTVLLDECAIVIQRPASLKLDDAGSLHCATGPCIEWADGEKDYAWHGTWVTERVIIDPRSHSKEEYLAITNTEQRRALSEAAGWLWVAQLLGAATVDTWTDAETSLSYELMQCPSGETLLAKQSPPLKDGSQPRYLEPVHEELKTARAARKWQATNLSVLECERDPVLTYGSEA